MEIIGLLLLGMWIYSVCSLVYFPIKIFKLRRKKKELWLFLSRKRLLLSALAYLVSAPFVGLLGLAVAAAGVSGSHAVGVSDDFEGFAYGVGAVLLAMAVVALALVFARPKLHAD